MKAILLSIQPKHLINIINGNKTLEIRKSVPKNFKGWVYLYCTYGTLLYSDYPDGNDSRQIKLGKYKVSSKNHIGHQMNGKVVCRFWLDEYEPIDWSRKFTYFYEDDYEYTTATLSEDELLKKSQLTIEQLDNYFKDILGFALYIKNLEIFDKPKVLSEFYKNNIPYVDESMIKHAIEVSDIEALNSYRIYKAPQSWQYVEVVE